MIDCFYQDPGPILVAIFGFGIAVGLLLAAGIMHMYLVIGKRTERPSRAVPEQAALATLQEAPVEVDDDCITCAVCWEERHPGLLWPFYSMVKNQPCKRHKEECQSLYEESEQDHLIYALAS